MSTAQKMSTYYNSRRWLNRVEDTCELRQGGAPEPTRLGYDALQVKMVPLPMRTAWISDQCGPMAAASS